MGLFDSIKNTFSKSEPPAGPGEPSAADNALAGEGGDAPGTYTVVSGDTLWKISERVYGDGSDYMKIFAANTDVLEHPDRVLPGQKLVIPEL